MPTITINDIDEQIKTLERLKADLKAYESEPSLSPTLQQNIIQEGQKLDSAIQKARTALQLVLDRNKTNLHDMTDHQLQINKLAGLINTRIETHKNRFEELRLIKSAIEGVMTNKALIYQYKQEDKNKRTIQAAQTALTTYCQKPYEDPVMKQLSEELASFDGRYEALKPPTDQSPEGISKWLKDATDLTQDHYDELLTKIINRGKRLQGQLIVDQEGKEIPPQTPDHAQAQAQEVVFDQISKFMSLLDYILKPPMSTQLTEYEAGSIRQRAFIVRNCLRYYDPAPDTLIAALNEHVLNSGIGGSKQPKPNFESRFNDFKSPKTGKAPIIKEKDFIPQALSKAAKLEEMGENDAQLKSRRSTPTASVTQTNDQVLRQADTDSHGLSDAPTTPNTSIDSTTSKATKPSEHDAVVEQQRQTLLAELAVLKKSLDDERKKIVPDTVQAIDTTIRTLSEWITTLNGNNTVLSAQQISAQLKETSAEIKKAVRIHAGMSQKTNRRIDEFSIHFPYQDKLMLALPENHPAKLALSAARATLNSLKNSLNEYHPLTMRTQCDAAVEQLKNAEKEAINECLRQFWQKKDNPYKKDYEATAAFIHKVQTELNRVKENVKEKEYATNPRILALQGIVDHFTAINKQYAKAICDIVKKNPENPVQTELENTRATLHQGIAQGAGFISKKAGDIADAGIFGSIKKFFQEAFRDWHFPWNKSQKPGDLSFMKGLGGSKTSEAILNAHTELQKQLAFKHTVNNKQPPDNGTTPAAAAAPPTTTNKPP